MANGIELISKAIGMFSVIQESALRNDLHFVTKHCIFWKVSRLFQ